MEAEAEEAAADLGPELGMLPVTPDIGWKPARPSQTGTDGSSCSALFAPAAPASIGLGKVESDGFGYAPSSIGEQCQSVPGKMGEEDCAAGAQASNASPQESGSSDKISPQEGTAANATSASATPIPTPEKVEHTPWRPRKRSTKGVPRFKVMKDKTVKVKVKATPKATTLHIVQKKRKTKKDGGEPVGASSAKSARRKLDFESSESISGSFSRAKLMDNLRCLAKIHGLSDDSSAGMRGKKGKKRKTMIVKHQDSGELAIVPYQKAPTDASSSALVPGGNFMPLAIVRHGNHWKKLRTKVLGLDEKTLQVYDVLRKWDETDSESFEGVDIGSGPEWDETRQYFEQCVDVFISTMDDLLGPRKFSQWGGSVIDSVVGTFLTQNVADNLSSNAFMNLAAKFPPTKRCSNGEECTNVPPLRNIGKENLDFNEASDVTDSVNSVFTKPVDSDKDIGYNVEVKGHYGQDYKTIIENFIASMKQKDISTWDNEHLMNLVKDKFGNPVCTDVTLRKFIATLQLKDTSHWDKLREEAYRKGYNNRSGTGISDSVDWGAVLHAPTVDVAKCIAVRGQHYIMACRIQAFLMRVKKDHGSFDLDWLQYVPRESAKNYLLSIHGLGDKSVDCIRLLSLKHKAFPVDVNVARIVTRLGWVKLQPLPFSAEFHSVDLYPIMRDVQRYLWPRLCKIHKGKLYELHCLMITFGKAICTKVNPNCSACPFSAKCKYYNSSLNRESLPPAEEHEHERGEEQTSMVTSGRLLSNGSDISSFQQVGQHQVEISRTAERQSIHNCEPIIEVPPSPEYQYEEARNEQEEPYQDDPCDLEDIVPEGVQYDAEIDLCSNKHMLHSGSWTPSCGKDLVLINLQRAFCQNKKLKNIGRLRTEHNAYVLPDDHAILEEFEERIPEDPCPYLLVVISCPDEHTVKGTILIPCRTATRGNFPLNGTYFQDHEVFADYASSRSPMTIPRECIWNLERCIVYFGSSIHSITKGQTKQDIQDCYKKGYICVRGFDRHTRYPKRLCATLHATNEKKENGENSRKKAKTSPQGKNDEKASSAN